MNAGCQTSVASRLAGLFLAFPVATATADRRRDFEFRDRDAGRPAQHYRVQSP